MIHAVLVNGSEINPDGKVQVFEAYDLGKGFERQSMGQLVDDGTEVSTNFSTTNDGYFVILMSDGKRVRQLATNAFNLKAK
jgi:hypothetical protein